MEQPQRTQENFWKFPDRHSRCIRDSVTQHSKSSIPERKMITVLSHDHRPFLDLGPNLRLLSNNHRDRNGRIIYNFFHL